MIYTKLIQSYAIYSNKVKITTNKKNTYLPITDGPNKGDWVANWAELKIDYKHGKGSVTIWANSNYRVENGKIVESLTFYNEADVLRQLGYEFINRNDL